MTSFKKIISIFTAVFLVTSSTLSVIACTPPKASLTILLVPSRDPGELNKTTLALSRILQEKLATYGFNEKIRVRVAQNYDIAATSVARGTAGIAYLPTLSYYQSSILPKNNRMHQLFQASRTGMRVEYQVAGENVEEMNRNGSYQTISSDNKNIFNIVKNLSPIVDEKKISTTLDEDINATYYRGYQFMTKKTLNDYYQQAIQNNTDLELQSAWKKLVIPIGEGKAIFNQAIEDNEQNLRDYWKVVWNIFERATSQGELSLSNQIASSSGRVGPIATMMETWLILNQKDENSHEDVIEARNAVMELLMNKGHFKEIPNYATETLPQLLDGRIKTGIGFADVRVQIKNKEYSVQKTLDEVLVFTASHGAINDGAVYSTRYFQHRQDLLIALQKTFIDLIQQDEAAQEIFLKNYSHTNYVASPILDPEEMEKYEEKIAQAQESLITKEALLLSSVIKPA